MWVLKQLTRQVLINPYHQAIIESQGTNDLRALRGILFLGTPHGQHVSDSKTLHKFVDNLFYLGQSLLKKQDFKQTTKVIRDVTTRFTEIISTQRTDVLLRMFFEEDPMPNVGVVSEFSRSFD